MQIREIVRVSANVCTCYSSNNSFVLLFTLWPVVCKYIPHTVPCACIHTARRRRALCFLLITSWNSSIGLHFCKDPIRHFDLLAVTHLKFASRFKFTTWLSYLENLHYMIRARLNGAGIAAPSKSGMCWDLMRNIPVRSIAVHQQQENLGR